MYAALKDEEGEEKTVVYTAAEQTCLCLNFSINISQGRYMFESI